MLKDLLENDLLKYRQLKRVYQIIHNEGPVSKAELLEKTKLRPSTLSRMIQELLKNGYIREDGMGESTGGRPPVLYHIHRTAAYIIGIDIARIHSKVVLVDLSFQPLEKVSFPMTAEHTPEVTIGKLKQIIKHLLANHGISCHQLLGIGLGAVGPLNAKKGIILDPEGFAAPGWAHVPIVQHLRETYPVRIRLQNGVNTAVLGEYYHLPRMYQNILYCISGVGLRCGVLTRGRLLGNQIGNASAYGHIIVNIGGRPCYCGKEGCLISYISLPVLLKEAVSRMKQGKPSVISDWTNGDADKATINHLLRAAQEGDPLIRDILLESAYYYGIGISNMIHILHPEHVILGGPLIYNTPYYYEEVVRQALKHLYPFEKTNVRFGQGVLKEDGAAIGAAILVFQSFFESGPN